VSRIFKRNPHPKFITLLGLITIYTLVACSTKTVDEKLESNPPRELATASNQEATIPTSTTDSSSTDLDSIAEEPVVSESRESPSVERDPSEIVGENTMLLFPGIIAMENLMPLEGVGLRPRFEWQTIDDAEHYGIIVFDPDGTPYWAWRGETPWVYLGGIDEPLPEINEGPILIDGMSWRIVAYDADEVPIATGGPWAIAP
jgi:hypothetical protein